MSDLQHINDLHARHISATRRALILLIALLGLSGMNTLGFIWQMKEYHRRLPLLLYDFARTYNEPLTAWWNSYRAASDIPRVRSADALCIPFQNTSLYDTDDGVQWYRIPLLQEYLAPHDPTKGNTAHFLGWELPANLYFAVGFIVPTIVLAFIWHHINVLRQTTSILLDAKQDASTTAFVQTLFVDRLKPLSAVGRRSRVILVPLALFLLVALIPGFVNAQLLQRQWDVTGTICLTSTQLPTVSARENAHQDPFSKWVSAYMVLLAVDGLLSLLIGISLSKIKSRSDLRR